MFGSFGSHYGLSRHACNCSPWHDDVPASGNGKDACFAPAVDIDEDENGYVLTADLPGVRQEAIEVSVHQGVLVLSGKREEPGADSAANSTHRERQHGAFCRQFRLGSKLDAEQIAASYKNGVLSVVIPKKPEVKPRQIPVNAS